ncbi:MAG: hypothetical protein JXB03_02895, partial [Spirochaetales bacterium]|nr:hypothetical protein [Spirochaetales bacterium]
MSSTPAKTLITLRQRMSWEALDAGVLLWRRNLVSLLLLFILPTAALAVMLRLFLPGQVWISWLALWWLKPWYDRMILYPLANSFFLDTAGTKKAVPFVHFFRGITGDMTWRRFSFSRSVRLPVRTLEGLPGQGARKRYRALSRGGLEFGIPLTLVSAGIEALLLISLILFCLVLISSFNPDYLQTVMTDLSAIEALMFTGFCINTIIIEGLYVAMGFAVYINARVEVEGWDLQFLFQKLASASPSR